MERACPTLKRHVDVLLVRLEHSPHFMRHIHPLSLDVICELAFSHRLDLQQGAASSELAQVWMRVVCCVLSGYVCV